MIDPDKSMELNPESLRHIVDWLDIYDEMASQYYTLLVMIGIHTDDDPYIIACRKSAASSDIQDDIRRWADEMEVKEKGEGI